ncbi:MAG: EsaB/YukD family protein [Oscillospiraceae bacterium]|nr:EsaB/YukD family protein [Oscillospiraceae bacterium]MDY3258631.1 EsaB/YukD family protein [Ruminococcus callidus]
MEKSAVIVVRLIRKKQEHDVEVPLDITANDLLKALNSAFNLGISENDTDSMFLRAESPIAFLKGNHMLSEYGVRNGTIINIM